MSDQKTNPDIIVDFAETFVAERPMIEWVLFELKNSENPLWWRVRFILSSLARGVISIVFGRFRATSKWSARIAYVNFKGISEESIKRMVNSKKCDPNHILNLNPGFVSAISAVRRERCIEAHQSIGVSIYSQGTCMEIIESFTKRPDVVEALLQAKIYISSIVANRMEIDGGKLTGRLREPIITKHNKIERIPRGAIFIGDDRDERIAKRLKYRWFEFMNVNSGRMLTSSQKFPLTRSGFLFIFKMLGMGG